MCFFVFLTVYITVYITVLAEEQCSMQSQYESLTVLYQEVATNQNKCLKEKTAIYESKIACMERINKYEDIITNGLKSELNNLRSMVLQFQIDNVELKANNVEMSNEIGVFKNKQNQTDLRSIILGLQADNFKIRTEIGLLKEHQKNATKPLVDTAMPVVTNVDELVKSNLSPIVFTATTPAGASVGQTVQFGNVIQGDGQAYDKSLGFTAPIAGYLSCQFVINKAYRSRPTQVSIYHNGISICNGRAQRQDTTTNFIPIVCSAAIKVNQGDRICIRVTAGSTASSYGSFSGILIPSNN